MRRDTPVLRMLVMAASLALAVPAVSAADQGRGRGEAKKADKTEHKSEHKDAEHDKAVPRTTVAIDRDGYVRVIRAYGHDGSLPPGLAKREALPPGLSKQLRERGELPPGLQKRLVAVPRPLIARLPPVPSYYRRYFAGDDFIVVDTRTNRIVAILRDVWR
jgi:hypothetical protein